MKYKDIAPVSLVEEYIRLLIKKGENGQSLPSQRDIAEKLQVSRTTVKSALFHLQNEGQINSQSRRGITINKKNDVNLLSMSSLSDELVGENIVIEHINSQLVPIKSNLQDFFGSSIEQIAEITRVRYRDGIPFSYEITNIDETEFSDITQLDLTNKSLYRVLKEEYDAIPIYGFENISATLANSELKTRLAVTEETPLYAVESFNFAKSDQPIEHTIQYLSGENFKYHFMAKDILGYQKEANDDII